VVAKGFQVGLAANGARASASANAPFVAAAVYATSFEAFVAAAAATLFGL